MKCVIKLTPWLLDEDHTLNVRTELAGTCELDRTRDDIDADLHPTDADIKHEYAPTPCEGHTLLHPMLPERVTCRC